MKAVLTGETPFQGVKLKRTGEQRSAWAQVAPALIAAAVLFCAPVVLLIAISLGDGPQRYVEVFTDPYYVEVLLTTLRISIIATVVTVVIGYATAFCIARVLRSSWSRRLMILLLITPLFISSVVRSFGWLVILGHNGIVNELARMIGLTEDGFSLLYNETSVIIGLVYILLPYAALAILSVFDSSKEQLELAAADLGAGPAHRFLRITLPLTLPGVYAGALMVFALGFTSYVTPAVLSGGRITVLPMVIYDRILVTFDWATAAILAVGMLVLSAVAIVTHMRLKRPKASSRENA